MNKLEMVLTFSILLRNQEMRRLSLINAVGYAKVGENINLNGRLADLVKALKNQYIYILILTSTDHG